jgi:hypothetical protein
MADEYTWLRSPPSTIELDLYFRFCGPLLREKVTRKDGGGGAGHLGAFLSAGHKGFLEVAAGIPDRLFDRDILMG